MKKNVHSTKSNDPRQEGFLIIKSANQWIDEAKDKAIPKKIFGPFWYEEELCILFADTNQGKSLLAVQIIDSITKGVPTLGVEMDLKASKVIYFDLELTAKQFEMRYAQYDKGKDVLFDHFEFSELFLRAEINPYGFEESIEEYEASLFKEIENQASNSGATILVIDNLSCVISDNEKARNTTPFLIRLNNLKKMYGWSILLIAHTPKRNLFAPISRNDIQGSKSFINLIDSCFAVGESQKDPSVKYLKQIKVRYGAFEFPSENVLVCKIGKDSNFSSFKFLEFGKESDHLKQLNPADRSQMRRKAFELKKEGNSNVKIAMELGVSEGAVRKWLKQFELDD
ncbi:AAA family ATPase [Algoriphagus aquimarinus]|uniref:AAA family ATPase n=1 Tax=Algoriphagus aquimarinus TaxID=237018 RepID=UPI0030D7E541|tara:strand:+ start:2947 stop:3969 length:1023 start_codon:yes stop_codon:yes gene_type:complete